MHRESVVRGRTEEAPMLKGWILGFLRQFGYTALRIAYLEAERADHRRALDAKAGLQGERSRLSAELAAAHAQLATLTRERDDARTREGALACSLSEVRSRAADADAARERLRVDLTRSEEHTSELQSLMRISYAVFCLKKKTQHKL